MEQDFEQLISLWESNFGDERTYIEQFLAAYKDRMKMPILRVDSKIVSSCYLLPAFISTENGTEKPVWYLYALSTLEEEKGKGYAGSLLEEITEDYFLVPVKGLEAFYEKRGLSTWLKEEEKIVEAKISPEVTITESCGHQIVEDYEQKRNHALLGEGYIRWSRESLKYAITEHENCAGKILKIENNGEIVYILVYVEEETKTARIKEITAEKSKWDEYAAMAAGFLKAEKAVMSGKTVMVSKGMEVIKGQGYFNLTLG